MARTIGILAVPTAGGVADEAVAELVADRITPAPPTAPVIRASAAAVLCGGIAVGVSLTRARVAGPLSIALVGATAGWTARLLTAGVRDIREHRATVTSVTDETAVSHRTAAVDEVPRQLPFVTVLVAARNESATLPGLLDDLSGQDHIRSDGARFEVVVVDDRSTDGTADVVRVAAARAEGDRAGPAIRLVSRTGSGLADGKGAALRSVPAWLPRGDVVLVLDADARVDPGFVRRAAGLVADGHPAVTARRRMLGVGRSALAQAQDDEQTADLLIQLGRRASAGTAELRGNGVVVTTDVLRGAGGWAVDALTEDLDLSTRLALQGVAIEPSLDLVVHEAPVAGLAALCTQRVRWAEGSIRRYLSFAPSILRARRVPARRRIDLAVYGLQLAVPGVLVGAVAAGVVTRRPRWPLLLVASSATTAGVVAALAVALLEPGPPPPRELVGRSIRTALFTGLWLLVVPVALLRVAVVGGELRYRKTAHRRMDC